MGNPLDFLTGPHQVLLWYLGVSVLLLFLGSAIDTKSDAPPTVKEKSLKRTLSGFKCLFMIVLLLWGAQ